METIEKLKKDFENYAIQQFIAMEQGNDKRANRLHKKIVLLYAQVKKWIAQIFL